MKHKKMITCSALLLLGLGGLKAQQNLVAAGGEATGSGGSTSYTLGQVAYTTSTGTNGSVAQGVQQPYEIYTVGINETELTISLSVFPNPTVDNLTLQISDYNNEQLSYQLYDMQGRLLNTGNVTADQTEINTSSLAAATYFLNVVTQKNRKVQSFKIIKN
tara:strand:+ start:284 stop:766 length:483 start_codon:yes stop_codon:yes gene_type:complete